VTYCRIGTRRRGNPACLREKAAPQAMIDDGFS